MPVPFDVLHIPKVDDAAIVVDGRALEPSWADAMIVPELLAYQPVPDQPPTGQTAARLIADAEGLHVFFHAIDPEPDKIRASPGRRDTRFADDWVGLWFDPSGEGQRQYVFVVNAAGAQMDGVNPSGAPEDYSWDGRWSSAVQRVSDGYDVEMTIPWRSIRHPRVANTCGMFVARHIPRANERSLWPRLDLSIPGFIVQQGLVGGPGELPPSTALALIPELTFGWDRSGPADRRISAGGISPGLTAEWTPGALQLLATLNPDYSQVESDAAQIEINERYALSLEEKRPFFTEGREWFNFPFTEDLVYTRSMVTPLYGVRATGEWGPWTVAAIQVLDQDPQPSLIEDRDPNGEPLPVWREEDLEGTFAFDSVLRVRRALGGDRSVGFIASDKTIAGTGLANHLAGVDGRWRFGDRWVLTGGALGSDTTFADGRALRDGAAFASGDFQTKHVTVNVWGDYIGPGFRAENGLLTSTDWEGGAALVGFDIYPKIDFLPKIWFAPLDGYLFWTTAEELRLRELTPNFELQASNGSTLYGELDHTTELFGGELLTYDRGLVEIGVPVGSVIDVTATADVGQSPWYDPADPSVGWSNSVFATLEIRPVPEVRLSFEPAWEEFLLDGEQMYDGFVARAKLETFTSPHTWQRLIVDRDTFDGTLDGELLIAWEGAPGNAFYLGGSLGTVDPLERSPLRNEIASWQVFAKGSWVFWI
jgi:hypothetical protein